MHATSFFVYVWLRDGQVDQELQRLFEGVTICSRGSTSFEKIYLQQSKRDDPGQYLMLRLELCHGCDLLSNFLLNNLFHFLR